VLLKVMIRIKIEYKNFSSVLLEKIRELFY